MSAGHPNQACARGPILAHLGPSTPQNDHRVLNPPASLIHQVVDTLSAVILRDRWPQAGKYWTPCACLVRVTSRHIARRWYLYLRSATRRSAPASPRWADAAAAGASARGPPHWPAGPAGYFSSSAPEVICWWTCRSSNLLLYIHIGGSTRSFRRPVRDDSSATVRPAVVDPALAGAPRSRSQSRTPQLPTRAPARTEPVHRWKAPPLFSILFTWNAKQGRSRRWAVTAA